MGDMGNIRGWMLRKCVVGVEMSHGDEPSGAEWDLQKLNVSIVLLDGLLRVYDER
jgi:hypothetical protein